MLHGTSRSGRIAARLVLLSVAALVVSVLPARAVGTRAPIWAAGSACDPGSQVAVAGGRVFVGGAGCPERAILAVAYDQSTGTRLWARASVNAAGGANEFHGIATSPSGSTVYVTGSSDGALTDEDVLTIAYDAATGAKRWSSRLNVSKGGANLEDFPQAIAVSPDGSEVFVVGWSAGTYALVVAYDAQTGTRFWTRSFGLSSSFSGLALSPDGTRVYATGVSTSSEFLTMAFAARTGATLWSKRYRGTSGGEGLGSMIVASPDGTRVFVSGEVSAIAGSGTMAADHDWTTIAYRASTGARLWAKVAGPAQRSDEPYAIATAPSGDAIFTLGGVADAIGNWNATLTAYAAGTGATLWTVHVERYRHMTISKDGRLYLGGGSQDAIDTAAFSLAGVPHWTASYAATNPSLGATDIGVSPDGSRVLVIGSTENTALTIAYAR